LGEEEPDADEAEAVVALLRGELYRSFFERARSPRWLPLLKEHGYFRAPPARIVDAQYIRFPAWPEARYLVAIAAETPDAVADAITEMNPTDNARIHADFLEAALAMPAESAARVAALAGGWLDDSFLMLVPSRAAQLVANLVDGGQTEAAARLSRQLLVVREVETRFEGPFGPSFEVKARIDEWEYQQFLENQFPRLIQADGLGAIRILRDTLRAAIVLGRNRWQTEHDDGSKIARNRIDQPEQFPAIENALITALRDAVVAHVNAHPEDTDAGIGLLEERTDLLFRRLELYLGATAESEQLAELRTRLLLDDALYDNYAVEAEYEQLLERSFDALDVQDQQRVVGRIEAGPDPDYQQMIRERIAEDHVPSDAELDDRWERWRLRRLAPIKDHLQGDEAERYAERVERYGEPVYPEVPFSRVGPAGLTAQIGIDQLRAMNEGDLFASLRDWEPDAGGGWEAPSREGHARVLDVLIQEDPSAWAARAEGFRELSPIYARHLFQTLESALREDKPIDDWEPLLELASHVLAQPANEAAESSYEDDSDHRPARRALAHLLDTALSRRATPFEQRERVWALIDAIAHDDDPTAERDAATRDPAGAAINSTRGVALRAAVVYGLWCSHHLGSEPRTLDAMPELRDLLEEKLDPVREPSPSVHAIFGQFLPYLLYLDADWTEAAVERVFPPQDELGSLRDAAWSAFVRYANTDDRSLNLALDEFRHAIEQLPAETDERLGDDETRLAIYVGHMYLHDLDDAEHDVVAAFFDRATAPLREHAVRMLGMAIQRTQLSAPQPIRLADLWKRRLDHLADADPELSEYGWWFSARKLDADRALELLIRTLEKSAGLIDNTKEVLDGLAEEAEERTSSVLRALDLLVERTEWHLLDYSRNGIRKTLETVHASGTDDDKNTARGLIHKLGERGIHGMQDLLAPDQPNQE
jgi:hypothetical protein